MPPVRYDDISLPLFAPALATFCHLNFHHLFPSRRQYPASARSTPPLCLPCIFLSSASFDVTLGSRALQKTAF